jgi:FkbM family methyltransferase
VFALLTRLRSEITFRRNGFKWTGPTASCITRSIFVNDHYQDGYLKAINKWLRANTDFSRPVVVNVGANLGDVALPLSRLGKRVIAIEPNPESFARLQQNVRQNGLGDSIQCCEVAISDEPGNADLVVAGQPGNSELRGDGGRIGFNGVDVVRSVVSVKTIRLETLLQSLGIPLAEVGLVWSDTQGYESQVISSAPGLWKNGTPLWVEIWPKGLDCHGGTVRFIELCNQYFKRILVADRLGDEPEAIDGLAGMVRALQYGTFTDALLIP